MIRAFRAWRHRRQAEQQLRSEAARKRLRMVVPPGETREFMVMRGDILRNTRTGENLRIENYPTQHEGMVSALVTRGMGSVLPTPMVEGDEILVVGWKHRDTGSRFTFHVLECS